MRKRSCIVKWSKVINPQKGGLGLLATKPKNLVMFAKLRWRLLNRKYPAHRLKRSCFRTWAAIKKWIFHFCKGNPMANWQ